MKCRNAVLFFLLLTPALHAQDKSEDSGQKLSKTVNNIVNKVKGVWNGAGGMLKGMAQGFGYVGSEYKYSYKIFNDAANPIFVAEKRLTQFLGASFKGNIVKGIIVGPNANSGDQFMKRQLYLSVWICSDTTDVQKYYESISKYSAKWGEISGKVAVKGDPMFEKPTEYLGKILGPVIDTIAPLWIRLSGGLPYKGQLDKFKLLRRIIYPWQPNDENVYYYRAYTLKGKTQAEFLDLKKTTSLFAGQFYNNSDTDALLTFSKDGDEYLVTLEANSFSMLESSADVENSIRPSADNTGFFQFFTGDKNNKKSIAAIPIASEGIGNVVNVSTDPKKIDLEVAGSMLYTYEVYKDNNALTVGVQGLAIGNFDQPTSGKIRDINPAQCHIWYISADQQKKLTKKEKKKQSGDDSAIPFDVPESLWIFYNTNDYVFKKEIKPGDVLDFKLLRPQLKEKEARLYMVSIISGSEKNIDAFLTRLAEGKVGVQAIESNLKKPLDKKTVLTMEPNIHGLIDDTQGSAASGIKAYLLLVDLFLPKGVGDGPYYYMLRPAILRIDQFANVIWFNKDSYTKDKSGNLILKSEILQVLVKQLPDWIVAYKKDTQSVEKEVAAFLKQYGNKGLFTDETGQQQESLNQQGKELLQTIMTGPISIKNYPILRNAGTNYYVYGLGQAPANWPGKGSEQ